MSYLNDKVPCKQCKDLYDPDQLRDDLCRDCIMDNSMLKELQEDERLPDARD
jgi:hypothetical protein